MPRLPYHVVELSPWPIMLATSMMLLVLSLINWFHFYDMSFILPSTTMLLLCVSQWWRDMVREATMMGKHTSRTQKGLRIGMMLFIISEVCFFFSFFWAFFHSSLAPAPELGCTWPPIGITAIDPMSVPLLNTAILLTSGFTVTWSHHSLQLGKRMTSMSTLMMTIMLGAYFTFLQINEYMNSSFTIADSIYGSIFFMSTGFHGLHVIIGTLFLLINFIRIMKWHFSTLHHFSFEAAVWYWHFVDVVWICLYISIYWWGSL